MTKRDDYLWDRSGTPDPEVEKLERALGPLAHEAPPLELPARSPRPASTLERLRAWFVPGAGPAWRLALSAAALVVVVGSGAFGWSAWQGSRGWDVHAIAGTPRADGRAIGARDRFVRGEWLETDAASRARIRVGTIGVVDLEPRSRLRLLATRRDDHRLSLEVGTMHAIIVAPPGQFSVETPSALAVDLGCAYTLEVAPDGGAWITVDIGWVSFEAAGRESFVPAGARCTTRPGLPPGTPCFTDAPAALKNGLLALDFGVGVDGAPGGARDSVLGVVLDSARREDALTLWHLLARVPAVERGRVFEALAARVAPPAGVTREGIEAGDPAMLDAWWNALGFGDTQAWRKWRRPWGQVAAAEPR